MTKIVSDASRIIAECNRKLFETFGETVLIDKVVASNKMSRCWGRAVFDHSNQNREIKLSAKVYDGKTSTEAFRNTVIHEFAHHVAHHRTGKLAHCNEWAKIMNFFGLPADVYVTKEKIDEVGYVRVPRKMKKYEHKCSCKTHVVGGKIHNRILAGYMYTCRRCSGVFSK